MVNPFEEINSRLLSIESMLIRLDSLSAPAPAPASAPSAPAETNYDIAGLARYLGCSVQTIHNLKKEGVIPFYRLGRKVYFKRSEIDANARVAAITEKKGGRRS